MKAKIIIIGVLALLSLGVILHHSGICLLKGAQHSGQVQAK